MNLNFCIETARKGFRRVQWLSRFSRTMLRRYVPDRVLKMLPSLARLGLACRGLLYIIIAALAYEAGGANGAAGAISYLGTGVGGWLVLMMLIGFAGYGGWRFSDGVLGLDHPGWSRKAIFKRSGSLASAAIHLVLANQCFEFLMDPGKWTGGLTSAAAVVLGLPFLWLVLFVTSAAVAFTGATQLIKGTSGSFLIHFESNRRYTWLVWVGCLGHTARGLALLWLGYVLLLGALDPEHARVGGVGLALVSMSGPVTKVLAAGLSIFGIYCLAEAWCRSVVPPFPPGRSGKLEPQRTS